MYGHQRNQSGSPGGHYAQPSEPGYYPQRPNSYFGASSSHSNVPVRQGTPNRNSSYGDSHEMNSRRGSQIQRGQGNKHAFGADEDSDSDSDDGQGFNVYDDFNNKGKRYSAAHPQTSSADAYRDPFASPGPVKYQQTPTTPDGTDVSKRDLVAVPKLGQDWDGEEARTDKQWEGKAGKQRMKWQKKTSGAGTGFHAWMRGEKKACGWLGWRQGVFITFGFLVALAVCLYFVVPRAPSLAYNNQKFLVGDSNSINWNRSPTNFSFDGTINLALDARNSYIPVQAKDIRVSISDLGSTDGVVEVATGTMGSLTTKTKDFTPMDIPIKFSYQATNTSDTLWNAWHTACGHMWAGNTTRPALSLSIRVTYNIAGLIGRQGDTTQLSGVPCPVELSASNV